ncbi:MAG: putative metal-binding motif-containing protein [Myxococcales bacterium]|nr:putative metal-binding motif-containing protein [Myxococcales bacterium]
MDSPPRPPSLREGGALLVAAGVVLFAAASCRSALEELPPQPPIPECVVNADCEGFDDKCRNVRCVPDDGEGGGGSDPGAISVARTGVCREVNPVNCDDGDVCTLDECDPKDGTCSYEPASKDLDGDGVKGPREGAKAGDPDSCGDDCDDTNDNAFPGNAEVCDGADNDCNGIVDDNAVFIPAGLEPVQVSSRALDLAGSGGLAFSGETYVATYFGSTNGGISAYKNVLDQAGNPTGETTLTVTPSDSAGGPIVWIGDRYGVLWQDRPNNDYEVYFRLLDAAGGTVVTAPIQVSDGFPRFSINPDLGWTGNNFVAVWQDEREGIFDIYGQILDIDGNLVGSDVKMTEAGNLANESPIVAASSEGIGVVWNRSIPNGPSFIQFQTFDFELQPVSDVTEFTDGTTGAAYPVVVWNDGEYVVAWANWKGPSKAIYAAVVSQDGTLVVPPKPITDPGANNSRYVQLKALGDRILAVYSDDRDQSVGYEVYARMVSRTLDPIGAELRVTSSPGDSVYPRPAFGPEGDVGILFRDDRPTASGVEQRVWFTRLGCNAGD